MVNGRLLDYIKYLPNIVKSGMNTKDLKNFIKDALLFVMDQTDSDFAYLNVWDNEQDAVIMKCFAARDGSNMSIKEAVAQSGVSLCYPLPTASEHIKASMGIMRKNERKAYTNETVSKLELISSILAPIINANIFRDLWQKELKVVDAFDKVFSKFTGVTGTEGRIMEILNLIADILKADAAVFARADVLNKKLYVEASLGAAIDREIGFGEGLIGLTAQLKRPQFFKESRKDLCLLRSSMAVPIFIKGRLFGVIAVGRDRGRFKSSEFHTLVVFQKLFNTLFTFIEYERERESFLKARAKLQKMEALGVLAGGIAHDFNNIINIIMGYAQLALMKITDQSRVEKCLSVIVDQCAKASGLAHQILSIAREHVGKKQVVNIKLLVKELVKILKRTMPENIEVMYEDDGKDEYLIVGNIAQINAMLMNLAANAKDAMPNGGRLIFRLLSEGERIILEVLDTGCGIPDEYKDKIFDPFFTTKAPYGTGLGLTQVYKAVEEMGGLITFESEEGRGTRFTMVLPKAETTVEDRTTVDNNEKLDLSGSVIVVEDNDILLETVVKLVEGLGGKVYGFLNPKEAIEFFKENHDHVEFVIVDVVMPYMDGIELVKLIRNIKPEIKCIFMTGYTDKLPELTELSKEVNAYLLMKPFSLSELKEAFIKVKINP